MDQFDHIRLSAGALADFLEAGENPYSPSDIIAHWFAGQHINLDIDQGGAKYDLFVAIIRDNAEGVEAAIQTGASANQVFKASPAERIILPVMNGVFVNQVMIQRIVEFGLSAIALAIACSSVNALECLLKNGGILGDFYMIPFTRAEENGEVRGGTRINADIVSIIRSRKPGWKFLNNPISACLCCGNEEEAMRQFNAFIPNPIEAYGANKTNNAAGKGCLLVVLPLMFPFLFLLPIACCFLCFVFF